MPPRIKTGRTNAHGRELYARPLGPVSPDWEPTPGKRGQLQRAVRADLVALFAEHRAAGTLPRSPRGAFSDLMPAGRGNGVPYVKPVEGQAVRTTAEHMEAHPEYVTKTLETLRRQGLIPEHEVADARAARPIYRAGRGYDFPLDDVADEVVGRIDAAIGAYVIDRQARQPLRLELFVEAEGMMARMARVAGRYGVPIFSGSGYAGLKGVRGFAPSTTTYEDDSPMDSRFGGFSRRVLGC